MEEALLVDFEKQYAQDLDSKMNRSQVVGSQMKGKDKAVLFFDRSAPPTDGSRGPNLGQCFTLLVSLANQNTLYDCIEKIQWGRRVMLFGRKTQNGGFSAQGHAVIDKKICVRFSNGVRFFLPFDHSEPCLQHFLPAYRRIQITREQTTTGVTQTHSHGVCSLNADDEDFSESDLARLRGDMSDPRRAAQTQKFR